MVFLVASFESEQRSHRLKRPESDLYDGVGVDTEYVIDVRTDG